MQAKGINKIMQLHFNRILPQLDKLQLANLI